jgi:hypothetical protein
MGVGVILYLLNPAINKLFEDGPSVVTVEPDTVSLMGLNEKLGGLIAFSAGIFFTTKFFSASYGSGNKKSRKQSLKNP